MSAGLVPAVAIPSMSEGFSPASASVLSAASACRPITETSGMRPILVVSAAPTTATDPGLTILFLCRREEWKRDVVSLLCERDMQLHVELQRLRRLRAIHDVGHHHRSLVELHDCNGIRLLAHVGTRPMVDDIGPQQRAAAGPDDLDV